MSTASADAPPGLSKPALHALADDVLLAVPGALERGIEFVLAETRGPLAQPRARDVVPAAQTRIVVAVAIGAAG